MVASSYLQKVKGTSRYFMQEPRLKKGESSSKEAFRLMKYQQGHLTAMGIALHVHHQLIFTLHALIILSTTITSLFDWSLVSKDVLCHD